jgi:hypothetical protein
VAAAAANKERRFLCRDAFQHMKLADIRSALDAIVASGALYFVTTHYPRGKNIDLSYTGFWFENNFDVAPFRLPAETRCVATHPSVEGDKTCLYVLTDDWKSQWAKNNA